MVAISIINSQDVSSNDEAVFELATIRVHEDERKNETEIKTKENEAAVTGARRSKKMMPTTTVAPDPIQTKAGLDLLSAPQINAALSSMTPEEKIEFFGHLNQYMKDVEAVKSALAQVKNPDHPTDAETSSMIQAALNVKPSLEKVLNAVHDGETKTSIWYLLAEFMSNDIMQINEKEESAAMYQVRADAVTLDQVNSRLASLNPTLNNAHHTDIWKCIGFSGGLGVGGAILGAALFMIPVVGPILGMVVFAVAIGTGIGMSVANAQTQNQPLGKTRFSFLQDNSANQQQLLEASVSQSSFSNVGTQANQSQQTTMQLHVTQTSQIISQAAQEFSEMIQGAAQTANTSSR